MGDLADTILGETGKTPLASPDTSSLHGLADNIVSGEDSVPNKLGFAVKSSLSTPPDQATRVMWLQSKTGLPAELIEGNVDDIEKDTKAQDFDPVKYRQSSPVVAQWLSEHPNNVSAAYEDLTHLNFLERNWRYLKDQANYVSNEYAAGNLDNELVPIGWDAYLGKVTPEQRAKQTQIEQQVQSLRSDDFGIKGFWEQVPGKAAGMFPLMKQQYGAALPYAAAGGVATGALAAVKSPLKGPVATPVAFGVGALPGFFEGLKWGSTAQNIKMMTALSYLDFEKIKDNDGVPLDRTTAVGAASVVGTINGALDLIPFNSLMKNLPVLRSFTQGGMKELLQSPTTRSVITGYLKNVAEHSLKSGGVMGAQELIKHTATELSQMEHDGSLQKLSATEIIGRLFGPDEMNRVFESVRTGVQAAAGTSLATGALSLPSDLRKAQQAVATSDAFKAIGDTSSQLKMNEKVPESSREVISRLAKDGPIDTVYAPVKSWETYWQSKGVDPGEAADAVTGDREAYHQAREGNQDIPISISDYATKIAPTEHNKFFADEIKSDPTAMNAREAKEYFQRAQEAEKVVTEEAKAETQPAVESSSKVAEDIASQLVAGGMDPSIAKTNAQIPEAFFKTVADRMGVDPYELYQQYGLKIGRPELGQATEEAGKTYHQTSAEGSALPTGKEEPGLPKVVTTDKEPKTFFQTPDARDKALNKEFKAFQGHPDDPIGRIRFGPNGINLDLLKNANLSTFLHENGHFYLEVMGDISDREGAPEVIKKDYQTLLEFAGAKSREELKTDHHEKIAQAFEAYLKEGKAPSSELKSAFARIAAWLTEVYRRIRLSVELTPEVRAVFDRMLATDDEIERLKSQEGINPLFSDPKAFGMNEKEAQTYREVITKANDSAKEELRAKAVQQFEKEKSARHQEERGRIHDEVEKEVNDRPDQIALSVLQKGEFPDGTAVPDEMKGLKLSKKAIEEDFSPDALKKLPKPFVYTKEGGVHPDQAAEMFGYHSGQELLDALSNTEKRKDVIEKFTDERMKELHGDMLTDGTMPDEALKALHNKDRATLLRKELQYLVSNEFATFKKLVKRISGKVPTVEMVRSQAEEIVNSKKVRDIQPSVYERAESRSRKEAVDLLLKGDFQGAFDAKQKELLNHELYRAASNAKDSVNSAVDYLNRFSEKDVRTKVAKGGEDYLNQIDKILDRFDLKKSVSLKAIDERKSLLEFVQEKQKEGYDVDFPPEILDEAKKQHYKDASLQTLQGVRDSVKSLEHLALLQNKLLANEKFNDLNDAKSAVIASILAHHNIRETQPMDFSPGLLSRLKTNALGFIAYHTRMEFLFEHLDGNKPQGAAWQVLFKPFSDAQDRESVMMRDSVSALHDIFSVYSRNERALWFLKKTFVPEANGTFTKSNMLAVALNWGNKYNRDALMRGYEWNESQVEAILKHLDKRDWETVQKLWDHLETFYPHIEALEKRLNGVGPKKVEASPVTTPYGEFAGGYYPVVFDSKLEWRQNVLDERAQTEELFGGNWARAMTRQGHAKERTDTGGKKLRLELTGLTNHISSVIHDITHREPVIDVGKLINSKDIREAIEGSAGRQMYKQLNPWLKTIAGDRQIEPLNPIEGLFTRMRQGATTVNLGWKVTTGLVHMQGYLTTALELGPKYAMLGLKDAFAKPWEIQKTWDFVSSRSEMMKERANNLDRDVRDAGKSLNFAGVQSGVRSVADAYTAEIQKSFFHHIAFMDLAGSMPAWLGAYRKAMDGGLENVAKGDEHGAIDYADQVVRTTKAAAAAKDLSRIESGSQLFKLFTMFYSQQNLRFNNFQKAFNKFGLDRNFPKLLAAGTMYWWLPAVMESVLRGHTPSSDDGDDKWKDWLLKNEAKYPFESIVVGRDLISGLEGRDYQASPAFGAMNEALKTLRAGQQFALGDKEELTRQDMKNAVMTTGYFTQLPTRQLWLTLEYFYDWATGNEEPDNPIQGIYRGLVTGKPKK